MTHEPGCLGRHLGDCSVSGMFGSHRDAEGRCTICGSIECRYPAGQACFSAAWDGRVAEE